MRGDRPRPRAPTGAARRRRPPAVRRPGRRHRLPCPPARSARRARRRAHAPLPRRRLAAPVPAGRPPLGRRRRRRPPGHGDRVGLPGVRLRGDPRVAGVVRSPSSSAPSCRTSSSRAARARGLRIVTTAAARLGTRDGRSHVVLADGTRLEADLVVTAVGDLPNVEWLAPSGLLRAGASRGRHPWPGPAGRRGGRRRRRPCPRRSAYAGCRCGARRSSRARSPRPRWCTATPSSRRSRGPTSGPSSSGSPSRPSATCRSSARPRWSTATSPTCRRCSAGADPTRPRSRSTSGCPSRACVGLRGARRCPVAFAR